MNITTFSIDIANSVLQLHRVEPAALPGPRPQCKKQKAVADFPPTPPS